MAQLDEAAAGVEPEAIDTAPADNQSETEQPETNVYDGLYPDEDEPAIEPGDDDDPEDYDDGEDQQGEEEGNEPDEPAIEAPVSLKAEEKEQFQQLPREAQQYLSEVLKRRDTEVQQGLETARAAQRQAEAVAADNIAQAQRDYADRYEAIVQAFAPQPPPVELARENPAQYQYAKAVYDEEMGHFAQLRQQIEGIRGQANSHDQQKQQEWRSEQIKQLMSIPEIANEETRVETINGITEAGKLLGYDEEALAQVDARDVFALKKVRDVLKENEALKSDAEKWRSHQARRNQRPRQTTGRFAPAGQRVQGKATVNPLDSLYPDD